MSLFQFGRTENLPTIYQENKTPVDVDVIEIVIFSLSAIVALAFILITPGYGKKKSIYTIVKATISILIGSSLMVMNYGQEWEVGDVNSTIPHRTGSQLQLSARIGIKIGLRSINITLYQNSHGEVASPSTEGVINYNERFSWSWDQGRIGFGPNAGNLQMSMRQAQRRGLPIPIIWILEYFSIDGEGLRYGRFYRTAGWHCHILLWSAFAIWILFNIFAQSIGRYAAYLLGLIGVLKITSCVVWRCVSNPIPLVIRFPDGEITTSLGPTFWLACVGGLTWIFLALIMIIMDLRYPNVLAEFLGIDILNQYDEFVMITTELDETNESMDHVGFIELGKIDGLSSKDSGVKLLKRRSTIERAQKKLLHVSSIPMPICSFDDNAPLYENEETRPGTSKWNNVNMEFRPPIPRRKKVQMNDIL